MINLLITLAGLILVLGGLYTMAMGFSTPPSIVMFVGGLIAFVLGAILIVIFAGKIKSGSKNKSKKSTKKEQKSAKKVVKRPIKKPVKPNQSVKSAEAVKSVQSSESVKSGADVKESVKSAEAVKSVQSSESVKSGADVKESVKSAEPVKSKSFVESVKPMKTEPKEDLIGEIKPKRARRTFKSKEPKPQISEPKESKPKVASGSTNLFSKLKEKSRSSSSKKADVKSTGDVAEADSKKPQRPNPKRKIPSPKKKSATPRPTGPKSKDTGDNSYVAKRLNMLKQEYEEGIGDVDKFIDEKIGSLNEADVASGNVASTPKPTISSGGSNLIWSFESFDVQDSLKDTLTKSKSRLVMMYPWIRNIDVGILKKFMDTDSRLIIQEAGLDDDASVELIKLLLDNNVEIRTMPHIHTVAAVSDEDEGLIISTDPIYDSFEVGVKYTDPESIKQINNLFEEAWKLSKPIEL